jgi:hypothetical protein
MIARISKAALLFLGAALVAAALAPAPASADFGLSKLEVSFEEKDGSPAEQAGSHPYAMNTFFEVNHEEKGGKPFTDGGDIKDLILEQARGLVGDATAVRRCSTIDFTTIVTLEPSCPDNTAVGVTAAMVIAPEAALGAAVYNLTPPPGVPVRLGFVVFETPVVIDIGVKQSPDYNVTGGPVNAPQPLTVFGAAFQLWGFPANPAHDFARGHCALGAFTPNATENILDGKPNLHEGGKKCPAEGAPQKPLLTLPRTCEPLSTAYKLDPWSEPGAFRTGQVPTGPFTGCGKLDFNPQISSRATTDQAETGSGLDFEINFEDPADPGSEGLTDPEGEAQSDIKKTVVTLPEGVTVNPSVGEGLGVCTLADLDRETLAAAPGEGCPNASKIGTVSVDTPLVAEPIEGSVFLAQQDDPSTAAKENPFDSLIAFYIVLKNKNLGILVKVPAKVEPDPRTGQLVTTADDIPQFPFGRFHFHFREGQRAPLITPAACGEYRTKVLFTPWARPDETIERTAGFQIGRGIGGGPCPAGGVPPFHPGFQAGSLNNNAASYSPFLMRLTRSDGEQDMTRFSATLPPGVVGKLAGLDRCPEAQIALARLKSGRAELRSPSCPANSLIGHTLAGAGVGSALTYVPGFLYLAGPFHGAPLSVVAITPAVAGPFDGGTVVVRTALKLNPRSGEVTADGAASDPLPHILKGIPLKVREIRVSADRKGFILNPTSCDVSQTRATLFGSYLDPFSSADDVSLALQSRYQTANCSILGFKPSLSLRLKGGTRRGAFPKLRGTFKPRAGDANLEKLVLRLPHSAFLEQGHFKTICTRVQFAASGGNGAGCPSGAIYGHARAFTPLLSEPLEGPVYLRSSNHNLPDLVAALHGIVEIEAVARIDSAQGGIRATFTEVPDAPVSKVVVNMQGGKKGLIVNSTNICHGTHRASAKMTAHNGKLEDVGPLVRASCPKRRRH